MASKYSLQEEGSDLREMSYLVENVSEDEGVTISEPSARDTRHRTDVLTALHDALGVMYRDEEFTDLEVKVEQKVFKCHRVIMAAMSGYFRSMLTSGMQESQDGCFELKDISRSSFERILAYFYYGENVLNPNTVEELLKASVILQVKTLERECVELMRRSLTPTNCISVWKMGRMFGCPQLTEEALVIILKKFSEVSGQEEFLCLDKEELMAILNDDDLTPDSEDPICAAVLDWVGRDSAREEHLEELLDSVCLPKLSGAFLFDRILKDTQLMDRKPRLREMAMEALEYILKPEQEAKKISIMAKQPKLRHDSSMQKVIVLLGGHYMTDEPLRCVLGFDLRRRKWYTVASIPHEPGEDFATCVYKNEIYLSGGSRSLEKFVKYSPVTNDWLPQPSPMTGRECHSMVVVGDRIYVLGGRNSQKNDGSEVIEDIEAYDVKKGMWMIAGKLHHPLDSLSAVVLKNKIYMFGGLDDEQQASDTIQCYDPATETCTEVGSLPDTAEMSSAEIINNKIYILTGEGKVYRFDESDHSITKVADFDARSKFGLYAEGHNLVVLGGERDSGLADDSLEIDVLSGRVRAGDSKMPIPYGGFRMEQLVMPRSVLVQEGFNVQGQVLFDPEVEALAMEDFERKRGGRAARYPFD